MAEIIQCFKEHLPELKLIGKCYGDQDRAENGSFGNKWGEWFSHQWFEQLEKYGSLPENDGAYVGAMRSVNGIFEYWIGLFFPITTSCPEGFSSVNIPEGDIATCYIYGREDNGELYGMEAHEACMKSIASQGWQLAIEPWFFERYNCPRFTTPDEQGKVILDYCVYIK